MIRKSGYLRFAPVSLFRGLVSAALVGLAVLIVACQQTEVPLEPNQVTATVDEVLADPQRFSDQAVTLHGQMDRTVSERVIALQSSGGDQLMLAILADQALVGVDSIQSGDSLEIVGTVYPVTTEQVQQVESQLGIDLDEEQLINLADQKPLIVAQRVEVAGGDQ